jgi:hypothetical protein
MHYRRARLLCGFVSLVSKCRHALQESKAAVWLLIVSVKVSSCTTEFPLSKEMQRHVHGAECVLAGSRWEEREGNR